MIPLSVLYAVIGTIGWGLSNAAAKRIVLKFGPYRAIIFRNTIAVLVLGAALLFFGFGHGFTAKDLAFGVLLSIAAYFPFMFFLNGLAHGKVGVVYPISEGWVIIAAVIGVLFLGDSSSWAKFAVFTLIVLGVLVSSVDFRDLKNSHLFSLKSGIPHALAAAVLWGVVFAFFKFPSAALGALFFALIVEGVVLCSAIVHVFARGELPFPRSASEMDVLRKNFGYVALAGVGAGIGTTFVNLGYATGDIGIVSAIAGAQALIAMIFAHYFYQERLTRLQYGGAGLVLLGIALAAMI